MIEAVVAMVDELRTVLVIALLTWAMFATAVALAVWLVIHLDKEDEETHARELRSRRRP